MVVLSSHVIIYNCFIPFSRGHRVVAGANPSWINITCVKSSFIVYHSYSLIDAVWQKQPKVYSLFLPRGTRQVNPAKLTLKTVFQCATVWLISGYSHCGFIKSFFYNVLSCKPNWPPFKSTWARLKSYPFKTGLQCKLDQMTRFHLLSCRKIIISIDLLQLLSFISFRAFYNISISLSLSLPISISLARSAALHRGTDARALTALLLCVLMTSRSIQSVSRMRLQTAILANRRAGEAALMQMCWQGRRSGSFIFFQKERWVNTKVILHEGGTAGDQNTAERLAAKQRTRSWFVPVRSLFFFPTLQGEWRTFFNLYMVCLCPRVNVYKCWWECVSYPSAYL